MAAAASRACLVDSVEAAGSETEEIRAADGHRIGTARQALHDVETAAHTAVENDLDVGTDCGAHLRKHVEGSDRVLELAPCGATRG